MTRKDANSKSNAKDPRSAIWPWWESVTQTIRRVLRRTVVGVVATIVLIGGVAFGFKAVERRVLTHAATAAPVPVEIQLAPAAPWTIDPRVQIPERLIRRIEAALMPETLGFYDAELVEAIHKLAGRNEWIRKARRIHRLPVDPDGKVVIRVECEIRAPAAAVLNSEGKAAAFVDSEGVRVPEGDVPMWQVDVIAGEARERQRRMFIDPQDIPAELAGAARRVPYVGILGVAGRMPKAGAAWGGQDMRDALRVIQLMHGTEYGRRELFLVNVANHGGTDPSKAEIILLARREGRPPTEIRFGRFPHPRADWVIRPERKMAYLDDYVRKHGRGSLSGVHEWIDVQFEQYRIGPACRYE